VVSCIWCCYLDVNVAGNMWCCSSGEAFLYRHLRGCSDVSAADDLAGVCPCNAACRRCCCGGSDDAADTHAQVTMTVYSVLSFGFEVNFVSGTLNRLILFACTWWTVRCLTLSNPVPWQNWMVAYLGYTLRMKMLFRGWPVMVHDTHTRRRRTECNIFLCLPVIIRTCISGSEG